MFEEEQGTEDSTQQAVLNRRNNFLPPGGRGASRHPPICLVPSHGTMSESLSAAGGPSGSVSRNWTEIFLFFFSLSPLLISFSLALSVLTPKYAAEAVIGFPPSAVSGVPPGMQGVMGICDEWGMPESNKNRAMLVE